MTGLPASIDPAFVSAAGALISGALAASSFSDISPSEASVIIECGVERIAQAGGYLRDGKIHIPHQS